MKTHSLILAVALLAAVCASPASSQTTPYGPGPVCNPITGTGGCVGRTSPILTGIAVINNNTLGATLPTPLAGTALQIVSADATSPRIYVNAFGNPARLNLVRSGGTLASPAATEAGVVMGSFSQFGYANGAYTTASAAQLAISSISAWSVTDNSTQFSIDLTPVGSVTATRAFTLTNSIVTFAGAAPLFTGTAPTPTGTGSPVMIAGSTDTSGEVTAGTSATSVVISFSTTKANAPFCVVTPQTQLLAFAFTISTTAITITQTATSGDKIDYFCTQH